jgi:PAS domain S-box-containing protein
MSEATEHTGGGDGAGRWLAAWQEAVRASTKAIVLMDLDTGHMMALSDGGAALFGRPAEELEGVSYVEVADLPAEAAAAMEMARDGRVDGTRSRRRFGRPDGTHVDAQVTGWAIRSGAGPVLGVWVAEDPASPDARLAPAEKRVMSPPTPTMWSPSDVPAAIALDERWRVASVPNAAAALLGWRSEDLVAKPMVELTHPDDISRLLLAFAQATTDPDSTTPLRLRHAHGGWQSVWAMVMAEDAKGFPWFSLRLRDGGERTATWSTDLPALTRRERDVLARLLDGQRVATMAREMYLSQRTIRNHLSAVFRKAGVHSQNELIELLRRPRPNNYVR